MSRRRRWWRRRRRRSSRRERDCQEGGGGGEGEGGSECQEEGGGGGEEEGGVVGGRDCQEGGGGGVEGGGGGGGGREARVTARDQLKTKWHRVYIARHSRLVRQLYCNVKKEYTVVLLGDTLVNWLALPKNCQQLARPCIQGLFSLCLHTSC